MPPESGTPICADCKSADGSHVIRRRHLCTDCFIHYVGSKILKRMESYRFRNLSGDQRRRLFLPVSGGVSSLVLLHALDAQLRRQVANRNKTSFDLVIAHVSASSKHLQEVSLGWYDQTSNSFTGHTFLPVTRSHEIFQKDLDIEKDLFSLDMRRKVGEMDLDFYNSLLSSATTATARRELEQILIKRLLIALAKENQCESVLWGHSDSKLAALVLADVAKGRGGYTASEIADGLSTDGINFNYPVRDLYMHELELYSALVSEPLSSILRKNQQFEQPITSLRTTSIDNLLSNYITTQGEKYPSIMANVVRTTSKLQTVPPNDTVKICSICKAVVFPEITKIDNDSKLCYGCRRMKQEIRT